MGAEGGGGVWPVTSGQSLLGRDADGTRDLQRRAATCSFGKVHRGFSGNRES